MWVYFLMSICLTYRVLGEVETETKGEGETGLVTCVKLVSKQSDA